MFLSKAGALSLILLVAASGCLGVEAPAAAPAGQEARAPTDASAAPAAQVAALAMSMEVVAVDYEGTAAADLCAPPGMNSCGGPVLPVDGEENNPQAVSGAGHVVGVDVVLTWDALTPTTEVLRLSLGRFDGGDFYEVESVEGRSPLAMTLDAVEWAEPAEAGFRVLVTATPPIGLVANPPQDFAVSGELRLVGALA